MRPFALTDEPIDPGALLDRVRRPAAGALDLFVGIVRNHNDGRDVLRLQYEAYPEMVEKVGEGILSEAIERFDILGAAALHRTGTLEIGDVAVAVAVSAAHRDAAFCACRYIIDRIKDDAPIWKKEFYPESAEWVLCSHSGVHLHEAAH